MNRLASFLMLVPIVLASCAETTLVKPDGTVLVNGGVWTKAKGRAMTAEITKIDGTKIVVKNVTEEPDGVVGPQGVTDGVVTYGLANLLRRERVNANNNDTTVALKKEETAQIPLKAAGEAQVIGAQSEAAIGLENAKKP